MLIFSKLKIFLISSLWLLSVYFALTTFLLNNKNITQNSYLKSIIPSNKVNLGLDLQGGSQLLLEIDVESYLSDQIELLKEEIKNVFYEESLRTLVERADKKIIFSIIDEEEKNKAKKLIRKLSKQV